MSDQLSYAQFWGVSSSVPRQTVSMPDQGRTFIRSLVVRNPTQGTIDIFLDRGQSGTPDFTLPPQSLFTLPVQPCKLITLAAEDTTKIGNVYIFISSETLPGSQSIGSSANVGIGVGPGNPAPNQIQTIGAVNALMEAFDNNGGGVTMLRADSVAGLDGILMAEVVGEGGGKVHSDVIDSVGSLFGKSLHNLGWNWLTVFAEIAGAEKGGHAQAVGIGNDAIGAGILDRPAGAVITADSCDIAFIAVGTVANTVVKNSDGRLARVMVTAMGTNEMHFQNGAGNIVGIVPANTPVGSIIVFDFMAFGSLTAIGNASNPAVTVAFN